MRSPLRLTSFALLCGTLATIAQADTVTVTSSKDNTLYEDALGNFSNGAGPGMFSGVTGFGGVRRAVMHFDIASAVPAGATINSVQLTLSVTQSISGPTDVELHVLDADWGEGASSAPMGGGGGALSAPGDATWIHTFFSTSFWGSPGGDFQASVSGVTPVAGAGPYTWSTPQMVADTQAWLDTAAGNFGWLVKHADEDTAGNAKRFGTREAGISARPALLIDYTPGAGCSVQNFCAVNPNSTGSPAIMSASGSCSLTDNNFTLTAQPVPNQSYLFFYGPGQIQAPFGNGFLCAGGGIVRINPPMSAAAGVASRLIDLPSAGLTVAGAQNFQCWFRDPTGGGSFFNTSDGLEVIFTP